MVIIPGTGCAQACAEDDTDQADPSHQVHAAAAAAAVAATAAAAAAATAAVAAVAAAAAGGDPSINRKCTIIVYTFNGVHQYTCLYLALTHCQKNYSLFTLGCFLWGFLSYVMLISQVWHQQPHSYDSTRG